MRKVPHLKATTVQGRPMANLGLKRLNKKLRHQVKRALDSGAIYYALAFVVIMLVAFFAGRGHKR